MAIVNDSRRAGLIPVSDTDSVDPVNPLRAHVAGLTGIDLKNVIRAWQDEPPTSPKLSSDWASVGLVSHAQEGTPWLKRKPTADGGLGRSDVTTWESLRFVVSFFGSNAFANAEAFLLGAQVPQNDHALKRYGLRLNLDALEIQRTTDLFGGRWVQRFDVKVTLRRAKTSTLGVRNLASADFTLHTN